MKSHFYKDFETVTVTFWLTEFPLSRECFKIGFQPVTLSTPDFLSGLVMTFALYLFLGNQAIKKNDYLSHKESAVPPTT